MENQEKLEEMKDVKVEKKDEKLDAEKVQEIVKKYGFTNWIKQITEA